MHYEGDQWKDECNTYACLCHDGVCDTRHIMSVECPEMFRPELTCPEAVVPPGECCLDLSPCINKKGELSHR